MAKVYERNHPLAGDSEILKENNIKLQMPFNRIAEYRQQFWGDRLRAKNHTQYTLDSVIGSSRVITGLVQKARKAALSSAPVMICGETGTGKELFAQGIHNASFYSNGPFIAMNCAAIPENLMESTFFGTVKGAYTGAESVPGMLEKSKGGTLFLDELNSLPLSMQGKLLRVLQEREATRVGGSKSYEVDCRIISATNQDPKQLLYSKILRSDLYFRLAVITLQIPPLKDRPEDILDLLFYYVSEYNRVYQLHIAEIEDEVLERFSAYSWPGNARELKNAVDYMMSMISFDAEALSVKELPDYINTFETPAEVSPENSSTDKRYSLKDGTLNELIDKFRCDMITQALNENDGHVLATSKALGISRENLYYFMKKYGIKRT